MIQLEKRLSNIIESAIKIIDKYKINNISKIDLIDIFPTSKEDEISLSSELKKISKQTINSIHGKIYILKSSIKTNIGIIDNIKIREFDPKKIKYIGGIDFLVKDFETYKNNIEYKDNINYIKNNINDFIEYEDENIFLYIIKKSNVKI